MNSAADLNATQAGEPGLEGRRERSFPLIRRPPSGFAEKGGGRVVAGRLAPNAEDIQRRGRNHSGARGRELASQGYAGIRYKGAGNDEIVKLFPDREKDALIPDVPRKGVEIAGEAKGDGAVEVDWRGRQRGFTKRNGSPARHHPVRCAGARWARR